jgi:general stress protein YciG
MTQDYRCPHCDAGYVAPTPSDHCGICGGPNPCISCDAGWGVTPDPGSVLKSSSEVGSFAADDPGSVLKRSSELQRSIAGAKKTIRKPSSSAFRVPVINAPKNVSIDATIAGSSTVAAGSMDQSELKELEDERKLPAVAEKAGTAAGSMDHSEFKEHEDDRKLPAVAEKAGTAAGSMDHSEFKEHEDDRKLPAVGKKGGTTPSKISASTKRNVDSQKKPLPLSVLPKAASKFQYTITVPKTKSGGFNFYLAPMAEPRFGYHLIYYGMGEENSAPARKRKVAREKAVSDKMKSSKQLFRNVGDVLLSIDSLSLHDRSSKYVFHLLSQYRESTRKKSVKLCLLDVVAFNDSLGEKWETLPDVDKTKSFIHLGEDIDSDGGSVASWHLYDPDVAHLKKSSEAIELLSKTPPKSSSDLVDLSTTPTGVAVAQGDECLLVFPFVGGYKIEHCAKSLSLCDYHKVNSNAKIVTDQFEKIVETVNRQQLLQHDLDTLLPSTYVNDAIINFWMLWITRQESLDDSKVFILSTFFYSKLCTDGCEAVDRWTKTVDLSKKKYILIPVNEAEHWSLCVVVQPHRIIQVIEVGKQQAMIVPCILHLDSLKLALHNAKTIGNNIRRWLNFEWKKRGLVQADVFTDDNMPIFSPKG